MFKISTRGDYGLLTLSALAEFKGQGTAYVSLKQIAAAKKLSVKYLSHIMPPLKRAGLVISKEGRDGGYALAKKPRDITMLHVLEVLEGPVSPVRCCDDSKGVCGSESYCRMKFNWRDAKMVLINFLRNRTLEETLKH